MKNFFNIFKDKNLLIITFISTILHLYFATYQGFKIDVNDWFAWALRLQQNGFSGFYSPGVCCNYTPGYMYILKLLASLKYYFNISDPAFYYILKLPGIIAQIFTGLLVYWQVLKFNKNLALLASAFILLNPALIFNTAVWGQIDSLLTLFMLLSIILLNENKLIYSAIILGISLLIKPQTIALAPAFGIYFLNNFNIKNIIKFSLSSYLTIFIFSLPFFLKDPIFGLFNHVICMASEYAYNSLFAYNLWGILGFWLPDTESYFNLSLKTWGMIFYTIFWIKILIINYYKKIDNFLLASLSCLSFYFLPTRVHERYLFPAFAFLIIYAAKINSKILIGLFLILSLIFLADLYYVQVYYNELYFNLPKELFNQGLFNFLNQNGKIISAVNTIIFIILTTISLKLNYDKKTI